MKPDANHFTQFVLYAEGGVGRRARFPVALNGATVGYGSGLASGCQRRSAPLTSFDFPTCVIVGGRHKAKMKPNHAQNGAGNPSRRIPSVLKSLPEERQAEIAELCRAMTLREAQAELAWRGIHASTGSISKWLSWWSLREILANRQSVQVKDSVPFVFMPEIQTPQALNSARPDHPQSYFGKPFKRHR